jgi:phosphate/phosphite/phosphonate ABC transporter binding protein
MRVSYTGVFFEALARREGSIEVVMPHQLRLGVCRQGPEQAAAARAFGEAVSASAKQAVRLCFTADYDKLLEGITVGGIDVAWMPPLVQARAVASGALLVAVCERRGSVTYRSALLVRDSSPYRSLGDLRGARAAWTDPSSASGHIFPRLDLIAQGIDPRRDLASETFFGSARAACAAVVEGAADLCACYVGSSTPADRPRAFADVLRSLGEPARALRIIHVTGVIPPDGFVVAAPVSGWTQAAVRDALLYLHTTPAGLEAMRRLLDADRLLAVSGELQRLLGGLKATAR